MSQHVPVLIVGGGFAGLTAALMVTFRGAPCVVVERRAALSRHPRAHGGRYLESDPIGLEGGINTYAYANNNPVNGIDPLGLAGYELDGDGYGSYECEAKWGSRGTSFEDVARNLANLWDRLRSLWPTVERQAERAEAAKGTSTLKPGPYAKESIPRHMGKPTAAEQKQVNSLMEKNGCHTCGTTDPGTKSGNAVVDHQPPQALGLTEQFLPHCIDCMRRQGGEVLQELIKRGGK